MATEDVFLPRFKKVAGGHDFPLKVHAADKARDAALGQLDGRPHGALACMCWLERGRLIVRRDAQIGLQGDFAHLCRRHFPLVARRRTIREDHGALMSSRGSRSHSVERHK